MSTTLSAPSSAATTEINVAGCRLHVARLGSGPPLLLLHQDTGMPDGQGFVEAMAESHEVLLPFHPGFGVSPRPDWMRSTRDLAVVYQALLAELGAARPVLVGLGFGGWVAAEMASMAPAAAHRLVLVGAMGIKPPTGDIMDQALVNYIEYARAQFHDQSRFDAVYGAEPSTDQLEHWDICREMCFRIAWKPYMYSQTLPHLLGGVKTPALVVWGEQDHVVPLSAGQAYAAAIPGARLEVVPGCGHAVALEQPARL
ncbi:MAG TPA: alpha/beta hydrolase, partial [Acetobacteraceae bacterium]